MSTCSPRPRCEKVVRRTLVGSDMEGAVKVDMSNYTPALSCALATAIPESTEAIGSS